MQNQHCPSLPQIQLYLLKTIQIMKEATKKNHEGEQENSIIEGGQIAAS
jgi:hypothetical protein